MNILKIKDPQGNWVDIPALKGDKGDKGDPGVSPTIDSTLSQANQAADAKAVGDKIDEITLTIDDTLTQSGQVADAKVTGDALNTKADQNGYYENLNVGVADQLASKNYIEDNEAYTFRPTGGGAKVGTRAFDTIVGGSVMWNQLVQNGNFADGYYRWDTGQYTKSASDNILTVTIPAEPAYHLFVKQNVVPGVANHKYLFSAKIKSSFGIEQFNFRMGTEIMLTSSNALTADTWMTFTSVVSTPSTINPSTPFTLYCTKPRLLEGTIQFAEIQCFDLTQMFGSEIADYIYSLEQTTAGAGVAWFRKYFPNDYYDYNPGELMHVSDLQSHDMVGFNLFDKSKAVVGKYMSSVDGTELTGGSFFHTEYIKAVPDTVYYISDTSVSSNTSVFANYDSNKNFIGFSSKHNGNSNLCKTFSNTAYIVVNAVKTVLDTFCINLSWSGTRDGEYEPYVKHSYPLDSSLILRGIPKLTADGDLSYDGDIYKPDGTVERRYGIVDLGTLTWVRNELSYHAGGGNFRTNIPSRISGVIFGKVICEKYVVSSKRGASAFDVTEDKVAFTASSTSDTVYIIDSAYTDATSFKSAMSGVYLVYELATPTTETAQPYQSPQIIDPYGTEEYVTTSIVPVGHQTQYPEDLRAKIESLPWDFTNLIAPVEVTYKATQNYTVGSLFIIDNILYKATANIANGGTITPNTNCTATTLAEIIAAL